MAEERKQRFTDAERAQQRAKWNQMYQDIFSGGGTMANSQYKDAKDQGQHMYRSFTRDDEWANNDETFDWKTDANGIVWKKPKAGQTGRLATNPNWVQGSDFDQNHHDNFMKFRQANPGGTLEDFIGSKGLRVDQRQGDKTFDPTTGLYYNDPGNDPTQRQFFNNFGHQVAAPKNYDPSTAYVAPGTKAKGISGGPTGANDDMVSKLFDALFNRPDQQNAQHPAPAGLPIPAAISGTPLGTTATNFKPDGSGSNIFNGYNPSDPGGFTGPTKLPVSTTMPFSAPTQTLPPSRLPGAPKPVTTNPVPTGLMPTRRKLVRPDNAYVSGAPRPQRIPIERTYGAYGNQSVGAV